MSESTSVENPVNQIAQLLSVVPESKEETAAVEIPENEVASESAAEETVTESVNDDSSECESDDTPEKAAVE